MDVDINFHILVSLSASSIWSDNGCCELKYAIDRVWSFHQHYGYFVSEKSFNPWFMIAFDEKILLEKVVIRSSWLWKKLYTAPFKNISVRAGPKVIQGPTDGRIISDNYKCITNKGGVGMGYSYSFESNFTIEAKVITIQKISDRKVLLVFDEVEIIGKGKFLCKSLFCA